MTTRLIKLLTTDGMAMFRLATICSVVEAGPPNSGKGTPTTCMLHTIDGCIYEVSGTLEEITKKLRNPIASRY